MKARIAAARPVMMYEDLSPTAQIADRGDSDLVSRLRARDPDALREAYDRFGRATFGYLQATLGDRGAAEDVQQQVFLEVWQRISSYDGGRGSLTTWIMTIARSRAIDHLRRRVPEPREPGAAGRELDLAGPLAESDLDRILEQWRFAQLLSRLPSDQAELLRYRFDGDLSQREIAERTGIPLGTVKARMVTALNQLREIVEQEA